MGISQSSSNNNRRRNHHHYWNNNNAYYSNPSSYSYYDPPYPPPFPFPPHLLPPPPPPSYTYPSTCHCTNPVVGRSVFYHNNEWPGSYLPPTPQVVGMVTPSPYVEAQQAKKVRSGVNVHKDSLKIEIDEQNPHLHLVSFVFDALFDGK
ncbi:hypothetical protein FXO37_08642 [Capsicum annuum]|nr:hypothetical protein FXO37_08642 [Capsicum annuum]